MEIQVMVPDKTTTTFFFTKTDKWKFFNQFGLVIDNFLTKKKNKETFEA